MNSDGTYRLPASVTDGTGDPERIYFLEPPTQGASGKRWVVWRGTVPGIYHDWCVVSIKSQTHSDIILRPLAHKQVNGVSGASHKGFGTPQEAWQRYEQERTRNNVHKLPYIPPGAPPLLPIPGIHIPENESPARGSRSHEDNSGTLAQPPATPSRRAPATPSAQPPATPSRPTPTTPSAKTRPAPIHSSSGPLTPTRSNAQAPVQGRNYPTPSSARGQPVAGPSNYGPDVFSPEISSPSSLGSTRPFLSGGAPPWEANSVMFVVFEGRPPGIYTSWFVLCILCST